MRARWLVLGSLLVARPAHALTCSSGAFSACASIAITTRTEVDPLGAVITTLELATKVYAGAINFFTIGGPIFADPRPGFGPPSQVLSGMNTFLRGPVNRPADCDPTYPGSCDLTDAGWDPLSPPRRFETYPHLYGCGQQFADAIVTLGYGYQTCDATGFTGVVVYRFRLLGGWEASQVDVGINNGDACLEINGTVSAPPNHSAGAICEATPLSITPEPSTWGLVFTGLLAFGFAARRRHKADGRCP